MATVGESHRTSDRLAGKRATRRQTRLFDYLPRGNMLDDEAWRSRHGLLRWLLFLHAPALLLFGLWRGHPPLTCLYVVAPLFGCLGLAALVTRRRLSSFFVTAGLVYCSSALVGLSDGAIEAHFHFFIIIGFIALYQDWVPFLWNIVFTVISHGLGSAWSSTLIFNHVAAQRDPWLWSLIHGVAVLAACVGMVIFWRYSEDEQQKTIGLRTHIAEAEIASRRFTSDLLVNLARRNQAMLHRQLSILNQLEEKEHDPDALAELFQLDHLATRIRRNAESLLVLSGEDPPRVWAQPVRLLDVVRAAIAETEDLNRVIFDVDEHLAVLGQTVTGVTHLLAELLENAVRFSDPSTNVTVRVRPDPRAEGTQVLTVEDWGVGMPPDSLASANEILAEPPDVDLSTSRRFGLHVVSRLAKRHGIRVLLSTTGFGGVTAAVVLPPEVFVPVHAPAPALREIDLRGHEPARRVAAWPDHEVDRLRVPDPVDVADSALFTSRPVAATAGDWRRHPHDGVGAMTANGLPPNGLQPTGFQPNGMETNGIPLSDRAGHGTGSNGQAPNGATSDGWAAEAGSYAASRGDVMPFGGAAPADDGDSGTPLLFQRVPQRNLSPHLRRQNGSDHGSPGGPEPARAPDVRTTDPRRSADALSRYQASRQAALRRNTGNGHPGPYGNAKEGETW